MAMRPIILLVIFLMTNFAFGEMMPPYRTPAYRIHSVIPQEEYPSYKDSTLIIPRVDTPERAAMFQDAKFTFSNNIWQLVDFKIAGTKPLLKPRIKSVETIITDSFPVQVFLKVRGAFSQCDVSFPMGKISQRIMDNRFEITIHEVSGNGYYPCDGEGAETIARYETTVPLHVYGLKAGIYQYTLDGGTDYTQSYDPTVSYISYIYAPMSFSGTFELKKDNLFLTEDTWDHPWN